MSATGPNSRQLPPRRGIIEHGRPVAAIVSIQELAELEAAADAADVAWAERIEATGHPTFSHDEVVAMMDALDQADVAESPAEATAILAPHRDLLAAVDAAEAAGLVR